MTMPPMEESDYLRACLRTLLAADGRARAASTAVSSKQSSAGQAPFTPSDHFTALAQHMCNTPAYG